MSQTMNKPEITLELGKVLNDIQEQLSNPMFDGTLHIRINPKLEHYPGEPCNLRIYPQSAQAAKGYKFVYAEKRTYERGEWIVDSSDNTIYFTQGGCPINKYVWILHAVPIEGEICNAPIYDADKRRAEGLTFFFTKEYRIPSGEWIYATNPGWGSVRNKIVWCPAGVGGTARILCAVPKWEPKVGDEVWWDGTQVMVNGKLWKHPARRVILDELMQYQDELGASYGITGTTFWTTIEHLSLLPVPEPVKIAGMVITAWESGWGIVVHIDGTYPLVFQRDVGGKDYTPIGREWMAHPGVTIEKRGKV